MGIFGKSKPALAAHPQLVPVFRAVENPVTYADKQDRKILARESPTIMAELERLGENVFLAVYDMSFGSGIGVLTENRVFVSRKNRIEQSYSWPEIAETSIYTVGAGQGANQGMFVNITTHSAMLDFVPNDPKRFSMILSMQLTTPRIANEVCAYIDHRVGSE